MAMVGQHGGLRPEESAGTPLERAAAALTALRERPRPVRGTSMLELLGRERAEGHHERVLRFLLDPGQAHGLGGGLLRRLLARAGAPALPAGEPSRARVWRQVAGEHSRPDLVVRAGDVTLVVELKIDAAEGSGQTTRQADDFATLPGVRFVYLTPGGTPPADPRFVPVSLRQLASDLADLVSAEPAPGATDRHLALDYLRTLENSMGALADDNAFARLYLEHREALRPLRDAAARLLRDLPAHTEGALTRIAPTLGPDVVCRPLDYEAVGRSSRPKERAVVLTRPSWLAEDGPRLGFGLGIRTAPGRGGPSPDPEDDRTPFVGVLCRDAALRTAIAARLDGSPWGEHWAWWQYAALTPQPEGAQLLPHAAREVAAAVERLWHDLLPAIADLVPPGR
ncbi:hypothetical protein [Kitasatospora sp. NPDC004531]